MDKEIFKKIICVILYLIMLLIGASIICDLVNLIMEDKINKFFIFLIDLILVYIMVILFSKTKAIKSLEKSIFRKTK